MVLHPVAGYCCRHPHVLQDEHRVFGFVSSKPGGERVVAMFRVHHLGSARLDYRDWEPHYIQVKVGACNAHLPNLEALEESCADGTINEQRILEAIG